MLFYRVSRSSKLGQFRWSGFFSYQQTGSTFNGINYRHLSSNRNCFHITSISSKSNLLEHFSQATFPQCYIILCLDRQNWVSSDGLDFFPINKPDIILTESTIGIYLRTGTALISVLSFLNRIFWNISNKPHFHNAISYCVWIVKIR